ncbi:MAG: hypothetical protein K8F24_07385 [Bacteroidales bacterium]|nr:hypothetical protein [Bacteroidales bacterium]
MKALIFPKHYRLTLVLLLSAKLLLLFSITACSPKPHPRQAFLNEIDSLQSQLLADSLAFQDLLRKPHDSTISQMKKLLSQTLSSDPFFESRSSRLESGILYFEQLKAESDAFLEEISYTAEQLRNLRHDIDQEVLDNIIIREYINTEAEAVKRIKAKNQYFLNSLNANLLLIETLVTNNAERSVSN